GDRNYKRSNRIVKIHFRVPREARLLAKKILKSKSALRRQILSEKILAVLSEAARIQNCSVEISNTRQFHKKSGGRTVMKQYGFYRPTSCHIYITNRTAVRGQVLAAKTFLDTLLHEWMHHYDFCHLKLNSIHSKGFYMRLSSLKDKLARNNIFDILKTDE
ncbi:hypothetical protein KJ758_03510, partial [Patescibacteria group bacterium]|nr:hypothetical protein [Patescibacteria group bacterium]